MCALWFVRLKSWLRAPVSTCLCIPFSSVVARPPCCLLLSLSASYLPWARGFNLQSELEVTLEANPGTIDLAYLRDIRGMGVNRLSLGMQSANPEELHLLERQHDFPDVVRAVEWARQAGFSNLNLDLIFGLPDQPIEKLVTHAVVSFGLAH